MSWRFFDARLKLPSVAGLIAAVLTSSGMMAILMLFEFYRSKPFAHLAALWFMLFVIALVSDAGISVRRTPIAFCVVAFVCVVFLAMTPVS